MVDLNATKAAIRAGYSERSAQEQSSRLLSNVMVSARVAELQADLTERTEHTVDTIMMDLETLCGAAQAAGQYGPAVRAKELMGKRLGMFVDRHQIDTPDEKSNEQMIAQLAAVLRDNPDMLALLQGELAKDGAVH